MTEHCKPVGGQKKRVDIAKPSKNFHDAVIVVGQSNFDHNPKASEAGPYKPPKNG